MQVTACRIQVCPPRPGRADVVLCYATVQLDNMLAIRDLRLLHLHDGRQIVAFPSRPHFEPCPSCGHKAAVAYPFCCHCGVEFPDSWPVRKPGKDGRVREFSDTCWPIDARLRKAVQAAIEVAYVEALNECGERQAA